MSDYKKTLNLPRTSFPMKANLTQKEPEMLKFWEQNKSYDAMLEASGSKGGYLLHDGPPYANGHIHLGTALNKILKDICVKSRALQGFRGEYVPGWDCHGLPIELKVEHELGEKKKTLPVHAVRRRCRQYADKFLDIQRKEFKRLGVFGLWDKPYKTMDPSYEAATAAELARFVEKGNVVRSKKPIYWCTSCKTALAEAEVEYADHTSSSIYVRFLVQDEAKIRNVFPSLSEKDAKNTYVIIWTTTPWTLPSNMAVALHPDFEYALVRHESACYILAAELVENVAKTLGWEHFEVLGQAIGQGLEGIEAKHPFYDRPSPLVLGTHVTLEAGTGCVHTAPGHGREDYEVGLAYNLEIYSPLDDEGRYLDSVGFFAGQCIHDANPAVIEKLEEVGALLAKSRLSHSYPHCWRCKSPVIFRATTQWFISMERNDLRKRALKAIREQVKWIPGWGEDRIFNMIESRPDWCISRQRAWGVPIVALLCERCGEAWNDPKWMQEMASRFAKHPTGCDYWYESPIEDLVPANLTCTCGGTQWKRETDILDVWFDSGTSFAAVMMERDELTFPADLYLEGSDQHRGWFHSSLLACMGTRDVPPYKAVLTHGYVVDGDGRKMSKSVGNVVAPQEIIDKLGAEVLRLWVSSVDYREDIRISDEILNRLVDAYRRIRNTCRYLLGNIHDLTPESMLPIEQLDALDRYALDAATRINTRVQEAYTDYEFHKVFHTLHQFCSTELSAFYLDVIKDRLYAYGENSKERRSAQTAMYHILMLLVRGMAPVLSFTAEEVFSYVPEALRPNTKTVFALPEQDTTTFLLKDEERQAWDSILTLRAAVTKAIEPLRKEGQVGHALDTRVTLWLDQNPFDKLATDSRALFIVSQLVIQPLGEQPKNALPLKEMNGEMNGETNGFVHVQNALGQKCERCWIYSEELGTNPNYLDLCPRCTAVLQQENEG